jgi:chemotaxis protein CheD
MGAEILSGSRKIHVIQGEHYVTADPDVVLTTILGSCVAACLRDPETGIGGMNHFLLPDSDSSGGAAQRFGAHAMELLINEILRRGGNRRRLEAKLFGGGRMFNGLSDVGEANAAFAERFLKDEGVPIVGGSLRGPQARRVQFWPASGRALQRFVDDASQIQTLREVPVRRPPVDEGAVELF